MKEIFKKITSFLKSYWNIYGSLIISTFASWLVDWNASQMMTINQYFGITISAMCLLTLIKVLLFPKMQKNKIEKIATSQKVVKNMNTSLDPEGKINDTITLMNETIKGGEKIMSKIKRAFAWLKNYRQQVYGLVGAFLYATYVVYCLISDKLDLIYQWSFIPNTAVAHIIVKIVVGLISVFIVYFLVRNQIKWVGVGSIAKAQEYLNQLSSTVTNSSHLSKETKNNIKEKLKVLHNGLKTAKAKELELENKVSKAKTDLKVYVELINLSLPYDAKGYQQATVVVSNLEREYHEAKNVVETLEKQISQWEDALNK